MSQCGAQWLSEPERRCSARRVTNLSACLAHIPRLHRLEFLPSLADDPQQLRGLVSDLEIDHELLTDLRPTMERFGPLDFSGSVFVDGGPYGIRFTREIRFTRCQFLAPTFFDSCVFSGDADFVYAHFCDRTTFNGTVFEGEA